MMAGEEGTWSLVDCTTSYSRVVCKADASESRTLIRVPESENCANQLHVFGPQSRPAPLWR